MSWYSPTGPRNAGHWFRVGAIDVTTTVLVTAVVTVLFILSAFAPGILRPVYLDTHLVLGGQVWRLLTWPLANVVGPQALLVALMIFIFWWFGQSLEKLLGRTRYLGFLTVDILLPAIVLTAVGAASGYDLPPAGMYFLSSGVIVAFAATYPGAQSWFGLPFWVITAVILGVNALQLVAAGDWFGLLFLALVIAVALVAARSYGLTRLSWIPHVPLPAVMTGDHSHREEKKRRKASHLKVVRDTDINTLLDKIAEHGINSLTREERQRLDEHSRNRES